MLDLAENTERPITVEVGSNVLVGLNTDMMKQEVARILDGSFKAGVIPEFWDGKASERIIEVINR